MFEYQTAISELTGLPVSNASVYEGPSAVGAAAYLAKLANKRPRVLVSRGVHPHSRATLETLAVGYGTTVDEIGLDDAVTDLAALRDGAERRRQRDRHPAAELPRRRRGRRGARPRPPTSTARSSSAPPTR